MAGSVADMSRLLDAAAEGIRTPWGPSTSVIAGMVPTDFERHMSAPLPRAAFCSRVRPENFVVSDTFALLSRY